MLSLMFVTHAAFLMISKITSCWLCLHVSAERSATPRKSPYSICMCVHVNSFIGMSLTKCTFVNVRIIFVRQRTWRASDCPISQSKNRCRPRVFLKLQHLQPLPQHLASAEAVNKLVDKKNFKAQNTAYCLFEYLTHPLINPYPPLFCPPSGKFLEARLEGKRERLIMCSQFANMNH